MALVVSTVPAALDDGGKAESDADRKREKANR